MSPVELVQNLERKIAEMSDHSEDQRFNEGLNQGFRQKRLKLIEASLGDVEVALRERVLSEFEGWGPLDKLLDDCSITEILMNSPQSLWYERQGKLFRCEESFLSESNYERAVERISGEAQIHATVEFPSVDGEWNGFRVHLTRPPVSGKYPILALRRHPENAWTLEAFEKTDWCTSEETRLLRGLISSRKNFLVVGGTGSGKTSVVNALLREAGNDRSVILEDCREISVGDGASLRLLTRTDPQGILPDISLTHLLRQALRLRPDRLVVGEIRGEEAKDFLMALSTGHRGSFGTLHAEKPGQALLRLEMLVQMGAPQWSTQTVRRLIHSSLDAVVCVERDQNGKRRLSGVHRIVSLEETGFVCEPIESAQFAKIF